MVVGHSLMFAPQGIEEKRESSQAFCLLPCFRSNTGFLVSVSLVNGKVIIGIIQCVDLYDIFL